MSLAAAGQRIRAAHLGPQRRRPQVLDAALQIAAKQGIAAVTMGAISERMGVSRAVVYACYPDRGNVLGALLRRETEVVLARLAAMLPPVKTGSVRQLFVDGFTLLLCDVADRPASWRIIVANDPDPALAAALARGRTEITARVAAVMRPLLVRWQVSDVERVLPILTELFAGICEAAVRMQLDSAQAPEDLAAVVGPAAYRALRAGPALR